MRHEPVESRHPAVVEPLHAIAQRLGDHRRFLRHRTVGGARAHHDDEPQTVPRDGLDHGHPRVLVEPAREAAIRDGLQDLGLGARGEDIVVRPGQRGEDRHHLRRGLALAEHGFGRAVAERAVKIHPREAQILHRQVPQPRQRAARGERAARDLLEQRSYFFAIHRRASLALPLRKPWRSTVTKW